MANDCQNCDTSTGINTLTPRIGVKYLTFMTNQQMLPQIASDSQKHTTLIYKKSSSLSTYHRLGQTHTYTTVLLLFWNLSGTTRVSRYQKGKTRKGKTNLDLLEQEIVSGSGICWAICKSTPHPR